MKNDQYFSLEVNLLFDDAVVMMMHVLEGGVGFGVYVALLTHLRRKDDYRASCLPVHIEAIARTYGFNPETVQRVLHEFGLFVIDEESMAFRSPYLDRVMEALEKRWKVNQDNGRKGGRPVRQAEAAETPAAKDGKVMGKDNGKPNDKPIGKPKLTKENKRELKRTITTVEYNSSNSDKKEETAAVVVQVELAPEPEVMSNVKLLQPVRPWESLVDEMGTCQEYLCIVASHSGLGKLFIENQPRILSLFKQHIRLYGKEDGLLGLKDVKHYFSNYMAMGSVTARKLREVLLADAQAVCRQNPYRYETMEQGRRMCLGRVIPDGAPPRPDHLSVWDERNRKWMR